MSRIAPQQQIQNPQPGSYPVQPRKPSGARPPPTSTSSSNLAQNPIPVRAEYFVQQPSRPIPSHSQSSHTGSTDAQNQKHKPFLPHMVHRPSMPSPKSTLIAATAGLGLGPAGGSTTSSISSSKPSPRIPDHDSLKESTRHNIMPSPKIRDGTGEVKHGKGGSGPRGHLPGARQTSANLLWGEVGSPKSPGVPTPKERYFEIVDDRPELDIHFDNLMDSLQVPLSVREKFASVSPAVKNSILSSAQSSNPTILTHLGLPLPSSTSSAMPTIKKRLSQPLLRKAKSSSSLRNGLPSPSSSPQVGKTYRVDGESFTIVASPNPTSASGGQIPNPHPLPSAPTRGMSMDIPRHQQSNRTSTGPPSRPLSGFFTPASLSRSSCKPSGSNSGEQPEPFIQWLGVYKATDLNMDVGRMKKLRMLLRHENTAWVDQFLRLGGYRLILERMKEMVDVEWREEQHDDQMLYELLRIIKALGTSEVGKAALRHHYPNPFNSLSTLLFSEKKPGDLPSRQLIIELWLFLFDLFPSPSTSSSSLGATSTSSSPIISTRPQINSRPTSVRFESTQNPLTQYMGGSERNRRFINSTEEVKGLLVPDIPDKTADLHEFVKVAHRPRVYRCWMAELGDICRDYFWIMCHGSNTLWAADEVDERLVEKPVAPGGATGGVEFEAMNYVIVHLKLLNKLCKTLAEQDREKAGELHRDLFQSGMDRILVTLRKASTTFYPALHLELARYVRHLQLVSPNARLPHLIDKLVGSPPDMYRRQKAPAPLGNSPVSSRHHHHQRGGGGPQGTGQRSGGVVEQVDQGSGTRIWLEDARKGGKAGDGGRRGGYDMQV